MDYNGHNNVELKNIFCLDCRTRLEDVQDSEFYCYSCMLRAVRMPDVVNRAMKEASKNASKIDLLVTKNMLHTLEKNG